MFTPEFLKLLIDKTHPPPDVITAGPEPAHVYLLRQADGTFKREEAETPPTAHVAADLGTVARLCAEHADEGSAAWCSRSAVVAVLSVRDRATLPLTPSPQLATLAAWDKAGGVVIDQGGFVRLLRTTLADCYGAYPRLLSSVRKLRTTKAGEVTGDIQKGKVSLGKSMVAEMSGIEDVPEEVTLDVPVFAAFALSVRGRVRVCVEPDPQTERFALTVIPGQIEAAFAAGESWLAAKLSGELSDAGAKDVPVYFGSP